MSRQFKIFEDNLIFQIVKCPADKLILNTVLYRDFGTYLLLCNAETNTEKLLHVESVPHAAPIFMYMKTLHCLIAINLKLFHATFHIRLGTHGKLAIRVSWVKIK